MSESTHPEFLSGGGVTGALMRELDWSRTPVGPVASWPESLRTALSILLHSRHPMFLWWGPELVQFYNDGYLPSFGTGKHPGAMGQRGADCWQEVWPIIWPQIDDVMSRGKASWNEDQLVPISRNGRVEEVYWTYGYSPVFREDGSIGGTLVVCTETTARVLAERRLRSVGLIASETAAVVQPAELSPIVSRIFKGAAEDTPFFMMYSRDPSTSSVKVSMSVGLEPGVEAELDSELRPRLDARPSDAALAEGPIALNSGRSVFVTDIARSSGGDDAPLTLVFGLSPQLPFDAPYRGYLQQVTEQLGQSLARIEVFRTRDRLLAELQSASRAKDEFFAMLGHELRNPLSPIVGALKLLKQRGDGHWGRPEEVIQRQVTHLVRLVDDLLDVSKVTRGKIELKKETVELSSIITRAVEMASVLLDERRHSLFMFVPPPGQRWHGDPVRLAQVIANLLTNAARYTDRGGKIELRAVIDGADLVISVKDNGMGIAAEMLPRVFDMFVQEKRSTDRAEGGLGLGLTLVKTLVQLHGGTVVGASEGVGKGSEFTIRVPGATFEPAETVASAAVVGPRAVASKRILVVDDNADAADMLGELLELEGHRVTIVRDALSALEQLEVANPEVAVLDIGLPVMDGYELAARMRAAVPSCRLIALSGYGQPNDVARSREVGFYRHLVKPFDLATLLQIVSG